MVVFSWVSGCDDALSYTKFVQDCGKNLKGVARRTAADNYLIELKLRKKLIKSEKKAENGLMKFI